MFGRRKARQTSASNRIVGYKERYATWWTQGKTILEQAHILIAGATGCGKSTLIHKLMWTALAWNPSQVQFIIIDMKMGLEMGRYAKLPHTICFAEDGEQAVSALDKAIAIIKARAAEMKPQGLTMYEGSDIYVVIDELAFLLQEKGSEALERILLISRIGRACRVHLLMATQSPQRSRFGISAGIQQNMTCRIGLKCDTAIESKQIIGEKGCEDLPDYGTAIWKYGRNTFFLPIVPKDEATYQERIAYWSDPAKYGVFA